MNVLFTPWRYRYLTATQKPEGCIFCTALRVAPSAETLTLHCSEHLVVMLNRYPYSNGHLMLAPRQHVSRLFESDGATLDALMRLTARAQRILSDVYDPEGFNVGINFGNVAGAGIADHYHIHVVPRWGGDSNFMTVTAQTRLIPEELSVTYEKLLPQFSNLESTSL